MNLQIELPERMSQLIRARVHDGEFNSAENLAVAAIGRYLDDQAEMAHTAAIIAEADASGDSIDLDETEMNKILQEALNTTRSNG